MRRLNPLGGAPVDMWTTASPTLRFAHMPTGEQKQKQRTFDALPKPDKLIRYRHPFAAQCSEVIDRPPLRAAVTAAYRRPETEAVSPLLDLAALNPEEDKRVAPLTRRLSRNCVRDALERR